VLELALELVALTRELPVLPLEPVLLGPEPALAGLEPLLLGLEPPVAGRELRLALPDLVGMAADAAGAALDGGAAAEAEPEVETGVATPARSPDRGLARSVTVPTIVALERALVDAEPAPVVPVATTGPELSLCELLGRRGRTRPGGAWRRLRACRRALALWGLPPALARPRSATVSTACAIVSTPSIAAAGIAVGVAGRLPLARLVAVVVRCGSTNAAAMPAIATTPHAISFRRTGRGSRARHVAR